MTAVFREVLNMSLSAAFLVAIVIGLRWCLKQAPKWVHCVLWALVAVRLICPSLPQSHLSMVPEQVSDPQVIVEMVEEMPPFVPAPQDTPQPTVEAPGVPKVSAPIEKPASETKAPVPWMDILSGVWLAGVLLMGLYAVFSYVRILKKVGPCVEASENIYLCDYIDTPFLLGFLRPRIYLPSYLSPETAAYVLAHERSHIRRRDHWWKPMGFVLLSIHWFNPMIWLGYILLCRDIEMACDEAVVKTMGAEDKKGYSHALLSCSLPRRTVSICPLAFGEVSVKERIKSVLSYKKPALWLTILAVAAVIFGAVFFLTDPKKAVDSGDVEYLETAVYIASRDELTIHEYDDEYRPLRTINYNEGIEDLRQEYSYNRRGTKLTRTLVCTHAPDTKTYDKPTYHSTSIDGVDILPGQTITMVYEETLDKNDNVLESILTADGVWECTRTYAYDEAGNLVAQTTDAQPAGSKIGEHRISNETFTYDALGNMLSKRNESQRSDRTSSYEMKWQRDEEGNVLRFQYYNDDRLVFDEHYTLDEKGHDTSRTHISGDGSSTTYHILRDEKLMREIVTQTGADGTSIGVSFYDERDNLLSEYYIDEDGTCKLMSARNYIGTDGFRSIGIPEEIYTLGEPVTVHPEGYSIPGPEQISADPGAPYRPQAARGALLYDTETNTVVCSYEPDTRLAPGNLSKIVTAYLALETCDPEEIATARRNHSAQLPGGPNQKIQSGEEISVRDLSAMMLLTGANDAAVVLAEHAAGSQQAFVEMMNQWVAAIGCTNTKFANVHGLTHEESHTTARDLVQILNAALKNDTFRELFGTTVYEVPATNRSEARELFTQNYMMDQHIIPNFYDDRVTGGMQAYAGTIGANLICTVEDRYIAVILGAQRVMAENGWAVKQYGNFEEMWALLEQSFPASDVTYYPSASYDDSTDTLTIFEYDEEFRPIKTTWYEHGTETKTTWYTYRQEGNTLIKTVTDAETIFVDAGGEIRPAPNKSKHIMEYHDRMDSNGNVIESDRYIDGEYSHSARYTYDGNKASSKEYVDPDGQTRKTVNTYDDRGNLIRYAEYPGGDETRQPAFEARCTFDESGNVLREDRYNDGILETSSVYTYDDQDRVLTETAYYMGKHIRTYTHAYQWRSKTVCAALPDGTVEYEQIMHYDAHGNLLTSTTQEGHVRTRTYTNYIGTDGSKSLSIPTGICE